MTPGQRFGAYEIVAVLGVGGMGEVYRARDVRLERDVAVKVLPPAIRADPERLARFEREARLLASLKHPNIATIHAIEDVDGTIALIMELVEGPTLAELIARSTRLAVPDALRIAIEIAAAIEAAHAKDIVHRDLKPANVKLTEDNRVKVLDFGLAKVMSASDAGASRATGRSSAPTVMPHTRPGIVLGTMAYMSPEQARGREVDRRADIWAFGAVLYEMLAGRQAFAGDSDADIVVGVLEGEPKWETLPSALPTAVRDVIGRCLQKDPEKRPREIADLRLQLEAARPNVGSSHGEEKAAEAVTARPPSWRWAVAAIAVLAVGALAIVTMGPFRTPVATVPIDSVAVLPFVNMGGDADTEYLSDGITDSLINSLSRVRSLRVVPRSVVFRYKSQPIDPLQIGRDLNVRAVLTGRVRQLGDTLTIGAELVDVSQSAQLWGDQYNRRRADILSVQSDIAREISQNLRLQLTGDDQQKLARHYTENTEAYTLYLKGLYHRQKTTEAGFRQSIGFFKQAIERDPAYPLAYAGLSDSYGSLGYLDVAAPGDVWPQAKAAATTALRLDDTLAEAHAALAHVRLSWDWDLPGAKAALDRAVELNPRYAISHHWYAHYWLAMGDFEQAYAASRRATDLEPLDLMLNAHLLFFEQGNPDRLVEDARKLRELEPDFWAAHTTVGMFFTFPKNSTDGIAALEKGAAASGRMPLALSVLARGYALAGQVDDARRVIAELQRRPYVPSMYVALAYAELNEPDAAVTWLQRAVRERSGQLTDYTYTLPPQLRSRQGAPNLLELVGLPNAPAR